MAYTVKQLAKLSGVSVRALHFYDEIGLLKPAYYGENGYRYYEEEQLLHLQQILFFRELEFPLSKVRQILARKDFDQVQMLKSHRKNLEKDAKRLGTLIQTIDKTIARIQRKSKMKDQEMFNGFDPKKQRQYEEYWMSQGEGAKALVLESRRRTKNWKKSDYERVRTETDSIHRALAEAMKGKLKPHSKEVQELMRRHLQMIENFYTPTKQVFLGLSKLYVESPEFRKTYDSYHPKLAEFMAEAMSYFAEQNLK